MEALAKLIFSCFGNEARISEAILHTVINEVSLSAVTHPRHCLYRGDLTIILLPGLKGVCQELL